MSAIPFIIFICTFLIIMFLVLALRSLSTSAFLALLKAILVIAFLCALAAYFLEHKSSWPAPFSGSKLLTFFKLMKLKYLGQ